MHGAHRIVQVEGDVAGRSREVGAVELPAGHLDDRKEGRCLSREGSENKQGKGAASPDEWD